MRSRSIGMASTRASLLLTALTLCAGIVLSSAGGARAASTSVWWGITAGSRPTQLPVGGSGEIVVVAQNLGYAPTSGTVTIGAVLPRGLSAVGIKGLAGGSGEGTAGPVSCKALTCTFGSYVNENKEVAESLPPFETIEVKIKVVVGAKAESGEALSASVSGGGAARTAMATRALQIGGPQTFGFEDYSLTPENADGTVDTQAGSHPFQATSALTLNSTANDKREEQVDVALPKTIVDELPAGFIGNPTPFAQCSATQFEVELEVSGINQHGEVVGGKVNECPAATAIGVATVKFDSPGVIGPTTQSVPIFNLSPSPGEPALFGFKVAGAVSALLGTSIRSGSDYGVDVTSANITEFTSLTSVRLTLWGVPGDPRHDAERGWECMDGFGSCPASTVSNPPPFLVMPTQCGGSFESTLRGVSWGSSAKASETAEPVSFHIPSTIEGCNHLPFAPEIEVTPDGSAASTPTGLSVDVHVPQQSVLNSESLAESAVKDITVALPEGVAVDSSGADGLEACSESLAGFTGFTGGEPPAATFAPTLPSPLQPGLNFCPNASKIGTVRIATPLLPHGQDLTGAVYLASQNQNPFGSLVAIYLIAEDPISGALVRLAGEVRLTETGQLIATFDDNPQLAFEDAELHFFGGARAPLTMPSQCGAYTTHATFTPWSGNEAVGATSTFDVTSGPNGSPCPDASLPFNPSLTGGTVDNNGGAFSALSTTISREDGEQNMQSVSLNMPPGLSGMLSSVKLCPEAQANEGTCGPESLIGETTVSAGVGSDPISVKGGKVYITEKYDGAPYGLSIVNPVKAGPFDLEHDASKPGTDMPSCDCIVVRAKIEVNPQTAALTITTDPSGPHAIPHMIDGIPVQIKRVNVFINRPGFTFNPTNCSQMQITGAIGSDEGGSLPVSVPFEVANCAALRFEPSFQVSTQAKTSKRYGASLHVAVTYPKGAAGNDANLKYVKVELPKALPANIEALKHACLETTFNANPASCPAPSVIGHAVVHTPVLPVPLTGPAYFVSHGGAAFPSLTMVLQGDGVTIELVGETYISKGVTSSTFNSTPDVPFEVFELTLPQGRYSALSVNGNLCNQKLVMPTRLLGQNSAQIQQQTRIAVEGCPPGLKVLSKKVNGSTLTLHVVAPAAGTLKASGNGLTSASAATSGREPLTLLLHINNKRGNKHKIKLIFKPTKGKRLTETLSLKLKRG